MNSDPTDSDLRERFTRLRGAEPDIPGFRATLAAASMREKVSTSRPIAPFAVTAAVALLAGAVVTFKPDRPSLSDLPVLLPATADAPSPFHAPLFADAPLPSDSLLPLHLHIRL